MESLPKYSFFHGASAVVMILALLWLTVSAPFVLKAEIELAKKYAVSANIPVAEEEANPFGANTEEKSPGSTSEEYFHDQSKMSEFFSTIQRYHLLINDDTYIAYHGELDVPPPNAA